MDQSHLTPVTQREQRLMGLLRRLLKRYDELKEQRDHLLELLRQLRVEHEAMRDQLGAEVRTADVLCAAAMNEALDRHNREAA